LNGLPGYRAMRALLGDIRLYLTRLSAEPAPVLDGVRTWLASPHTGGDHAISAETAVVYRGGGRRYFTKRSAYRAEAKHRIRAAFNLTGDDLGNVEVDEVWRWIDALAAKMIRGEPADFDIENPTGANHD
jgi:hypothetical protein